MQPIHAIPPLTEEGVQKLVGMQCLAPRIPNKFYQRKRARSLIKDITLVNAKKCYLRVETIFGVRSRIYGTSNS